MLHFKQWVEICKKVPFKETHTYFISKRAVWWKESATTIDDGNVFVQWPLYLFALFFQFFSHCVATNWLLFCRKNTSSRRVTNDILWLTLIRFLIGAWRRLTCKERLRELGYVLMYYIWYLCEEFFNSIVYSTCNSRSKLEYMHITRAYYGIRHLPRYKYLI